MVNYIYLCRRFSKQINMDIKERIEQVIAQKGLQKQEVAIRMGKVKQAFNSLITDPKWSVIENVAEAIGISTQELLFGHEYDKPTDGMFTCPKCGAGVRIKIEVD